MGRPKKAVNYEEAIEHVNMRIDGLKKTITELEKERKQLIEQQEQNVMSQLYVVYKESGMTMQELMNLVSVNIKNP